MQKLFAAVVVLALSLTAAQSLANRIDPQARDSAIYVTAISNEAVEVLYNPEISERIRSLRLNELFAEAFGAEFMSKMVLGNHWDKAKPREKARFRDAFRRYLINHLRGKLEGSTPMSFHVTGAKMLDHQDSRVTTSVVQFGLHVGEVGWLVRDLGNDIEIIDIVIRGASVVQTFQGEFRGFATREGLGALISAMEEKIVVH